MSASFAARSLLLVLAAALPYLAFLPMPPVSDDYLQIALSRDFVSSDGWRQLAGDALYRCRATSLVFTHGIDTFAGASPIAHRLGSIMLHALNGGLIVLFGSWPVIGYPRAFLAAIAFLLLPGYHEAVVWIAAVHDLLVFGFAMAALLCWIHWLRTRQRQWLLAALFLFPLALASKESAAVLPVLFLGAWLVEGNRRRADLAVVAAALAASLGYTALVFQASRGHLHLNDGTFSLQAPVLANLLRTLFAIWMPWGFLAAALLLWKRRGREVLAVLCFSMVTLLPYSFLTHSLEAPSRHRYWATVGAALLIACAFDALRKMPPRPARAAAWVTAAVFALSGPVLLLSREQSDYIHRALPTESFLHFAEAHGAPVWVGETPYRFEIYRAAARIALGWDPEDIQDATKNIPPQGKPVFTYGQLI